MSKSQLTFHAKYTIHYWRNSYSDVLYFIKSIHHRSPQTCSNLRARSPHSDYIPPHSSENVLTLRTSDSDVVSSPPMRKPFLTLVPNLPPPIKSRSGIS